MFSGTSTCAATLRDVYSFPNENNIWIGSISRLSRLTAYSAASLAPLLRFFLGTSDFASTGARNLPV
jgi:hypothetical protein